MDEVLISLRINYNPEEQLNLLGSERRGRFYSFILRLFSVRETGTKQRPLVGTSRRCPNLSTASII